MNKLKRIRFKNIMYSLPKRTLIVGHPSCFTGFMEDHEDLIERDYRSATFEDKTIHFTDFSGRYPSNGVRKPELILYSDERDLDDIHRVFGHTKPMIIYMLLDVEGFKKQYE